MFSRVAISATISVVLSLTMANRSWCEGGVATTASPLPETVETGQRWMSRIHDNTRLNRISIPGTHDTCALHNGFSLGFARCQTWSLEDQLRSGIRFLDIRCRHLNDDFHIYHGAIDQHISFREVRDQCRSFLKDNPSEVIVMSIKQESKPVGNTRTFAKTFRSLAKDDVNLWHVRERVPELKTVRGKIVVLDRVGTLGGIPWRTLRVQDDYRAPMKKKLKLLKAHFEAASQSANHQWYVNYCSGTNPEKLITPLRYARLTNPTAMEYLSGIRNKRRPVYVGTIMMDFPSDRLIKLIIKTNSLSRLGANAND